MNKHNEESGLPKPGTATSHQLIEHFTQPDTGVSTKQLLGAIIQSSDVNSTFADIAKLDPDRYKKSRTWVTTQVTSNSLSAISEENVRAIIACCNAELRAKQAQDPTVALISEQEISRVIDLAKKEIEIYGDSSRKARQERFTKPVLFEPPRGISDPGKHLPKYGDGGGKRSI